LSITGPLRRKRHIPCETGAIHEEKQPEKHLQQSALRDHFNRAVAPAFAHLGMTEHIPDCGHGHPPDGSKSAPPYY